MKHSSTKMIALISLLGCGDWPQYAHVPTHNSAAIPTSDSPATAIEIDWQEEQELAEPNDAVGDAFVLAMGQGVRQIGTLLGAGWDPEAEPTRISECGQPLAFPPDSPGDYTGDVDWLTLQTEDAATLCAAVTLDNPDLSFDLTLYVLDDCDMPVEVFVDNEGPIGVERTGGRWSGEVTVPAGSRIGMALSSYWPDDPALETEWLITASLVPPLTDIDLCPALP